MEWQPIKSFVATRQPGRLFPLFLVTDGLRVEPAEYDEDNRKHPWRCITNPDVDGSTTDLPFKPTHWMEMPAPPSDTKGV